MSQIAVFERVDTGAGRTLLAGVGVVSFASLLLELALTRLFSVVLFYHFAFLAISTALLGLGAGGVFAHLRRDALLRRDLRSLGALLTAINAVAIVLALEVILHVPVSLDLGWANFGRLTATYAAAALPFFFTGVLFSVVFARESAHTAQLYGADLLGGALACLVTVPALDWLGGPNAVVFAALAMAIASAVWADGSKARKLPAGLAGALVLLLLLNHSGLLLDIVYAKGKRRDQLWMEFAKWNAISRVEVDKVGQAKYIVIDADASTAIMNVDPRRWDEVAAPPGGADRVGSLSGGGAGYNWRKDLMSAAPSVANVLRPRGSYAIIGPGGGVDVLRAVANGSPSVTGIEINPIIANTIMRGRYADYAHHLYELPQVRIHVGDGRSWLRASRDRYDVIQMTLVDTWASTAAGAFALSENNLYTVEAFREYFAHLKPDGIIAVTRWEFKQPREALRVAAQELELLNAMRVPDPASHFVIVSDGPLDSDGRPVTVLMKHSPFTEQEQALVRDHLATNPKLHALYLPADMLSKRSPGPLPQQGDERLASQDAFYHLIGLGDPRLFAAHYPFDISPVTDNAPFFFFTFRTRQVLAHIIAGTVQGMDWKNNLGVVVLGMVLVISIAAVLGFLVLPLLLHGEARGQPLLPLLYFIAVGLGYIMVEIVMIQRFVLFLGHPTYALTVVIFLMLLASGTGSLASRQWMSHSRRLGWVLSVVAVWALAYLWLLPRVLAGLVGLPFLAKLMVSGALLAPLAFLMGMPFPTGLRALAAAARQPDTRAATEWAWAMNASSSVLGSVLAVVLAIHFGLNFTLGCAAAAYLLALLLTRPFLHSDGTLLTRS